MIASSKMESPPNRDFDAIFFPPKIDSYISFQYGDIISMSDIDVFLVQLIVMDINSHSGMENIR